MLQDLSDSQLKALWRQGKIPVIFKRNKPLPVLARIPFAEGNMEWLRDGRRSKPEWCAQFKAWEIPAAWFDSVIKLALRRHQQVYVIQLYREHQKCAPACWNAEGFHCECSCMGENHGGGHPGGSWYEVSETFAVSWGAQRYSCRHLKVKGTSPPARLDGD
ncbi:hypothetical protein [Acidithiobacillus ferrianus]|uniref:hypothetical protein n=1 Tax=Acidithiobacillus ferrianus TaxID=2678518 RepID=UPI0034E50B8A